MTSNTRRIAPRKWTSLAVTGLTAGLVATGPAHADFTTSASPEKLWLAQAEGGEGGEAGAVADASPDVAYLARLSLVKGHLLAAVRLYRKGLVDEAVGLAGHPEAEMMEEVRESLAAHDAADFSPELEKVGEVMADGASQAEVDAAMADLSRAIDAAAEQADAPVRVQLDALIRLVRAAGDEYAGSIENGEVTDVIPWHEAYGFIEIARGQAEELAASGDETVSKAAKRILAALDKTPEAFGDISQTEAHAGDPGILYAAAAEIEFATAGVE